jgi:hypothetical protein
MRWHRPDASGPLLTSITTSSGSHGRQSPGIILRNCSPHPPSTGAAPCLSRGAHEPPPQNLRIRYGPILRAGSARQRIQRGPASRLIPGGLACQPRQHLRRRRGCGVAPVRELCSDDGWRPISSATARMDDGSTRLNAWFRAALTCSASTSASLIMAAQLPLPIHPPICPTIQPRGSGSAGLGGWTMDGSEDSGSAGAGTAAGSLLIVPDGWW